MPIKLKHPKSIIQDLRSKRRKALMVILVLLLLVTSVRVWQFFSPDTASASWWNDSWAYRKSVTISNAGTAQTDYQVEITLDTATLITAGKMQSDCDDIRILDSDHQEIPFWVNTGPAWDCNESDTRIWVKIPSIPTTDKTLYIYYGNSGAASASSGENTFIVYYDFEDQDLGDWFHTGTVDTSTTIDTARKVAGSYSMKIDDSNSDTGGNTTLLNFVKTDGVAIDMAFNFNKDANSEKWWFWTNEIVVGRYIDAALSRDGEFDYRKNDNSWVSLYDTTNDTWYHVSYQTETVADDHYDIYLYNTSGSQLASLTGATVDNNSLVDGVDRMTLKLNDGPSTGSGWVDNVVIRKHAASAPTAGSPASEEIGPGPIAYWKFDEGADNTCPSGDDVCDSTANTNDGAFTGSTAWQTEDLCISEKCIYFDGSGDYVTITDSDSLDFDYDEDFSIAFWLRDPGGNANQDAIIEKYGASAYPYAIRYNNADKVRMYRYDGSNVPYVDSTSVINDNRWHHITAVKNGSAMYMYFDGIQEGYADDTTTATTTNGDNLCMGSRCTGAQNYNGFLDEVKIYPYARTADQIKQDYLGGGSKGSAASFSPDNSFLSDGLIGYWKMDEATWTLNSKDALDASGNGNDLNVEGTAGDPVAGKYGKAGDFDGTGDYVCSDTDSNGICDMTSDLILNGPLVVAAWIYLDDNTINYPGIAGFGTYATAGEDNISYHLGLGGGVGVAKDLRLTISNGVESGDGSTQSTVASSTTITTGQWVHVVGTWDGKDDSESLKIYLDGKLDNTAASTITTLNQSTAVDNYFDIGARASNSGNGNFNGDIDEVRVYNRALSPAEIRQLADWAPGPITYYPLDEGTGIPADTGEVKDRSGNGYHGEMESSMTLDDWVPGKFGSALEFDGTNDEVLVTEATAFDFGTTTDFTMMGWVKITDTGADQKIFDRISGSGGSWVLKYDDSANAPDFNVANSGGSYCLFNAVTDIEDGQWHHIAGVVKMNASCTTDDIYLVIDGVKDGGSIAGGSTINTNAADIEVAGFQFSDNSNTVNGVIDDVRVYNYARTAGQIVEDMNAGHPAPGSPVGSALGHWKFDEGYGDAGNNSGTAGSSGNADLAGSAQTCPTGVDDECPTWTNGGKFGKALNFDIGGVDEYALVNDPLVSDYPFTISAWAKTNGAQAATRIIAGLGNSAVGNDSTRLDINSSGNAQLRVDNSGTVDTVTGTEIDDSNWHHVVGVLTSATERHLYVDGVLRGSGYPNVAFETSVDGWGIGRDGDSTSTSTWEGWIDDVRVYGSALTQDQINQLYNQGRAAVFGAKSSNTSGVGSYSASSEYCPPGSTDSCTAPVAEWKLDTNTGTTAIDTGGSAYDLPMQALSANHYYWAPGKQGRGMFLGDNADGSGYSSACFYHGSTETAPHPDTISISMWIKRDSLTRRGHPLGYANPVSGTYRYVFRMDGTGDLEFKFGASSGNVYETTNDLITDNDWHFVTLNYTYGTASSMEIRVDGGPVAAGSWTTGSGDSAKYTGGSSNRLSLGCQYDSTSPSAVDSRYGVSGTIDTTRIYDYARTPAQIAWEYNRGGPVGWWRLDECQGTTANDASGNGNNGTITPGGAPNTSAGTCSSDDSTEMWDDGTTGKRNASLGFDGTDDWVSIGDTNDLSFGDSTNDFPFSISAWVNMNDATNFNIFSKGSNASREYELSIDLTGDNLRFYLYDTTTTLLSAESVRSFTTDEGSWIHIVATYDGTTNESGLAVYRNSVAIAINTSNVTYTAMDNEAAGAAIGRFFTDGSAWADGQIDDVKIFNYALTGEQIKDEFNKGAVRFE